MAIAVAVAGFVVVGCDGATAMPNAPLAGSESAPTVLVTLVARDIRFEPALVSVLTGRPVVITLDNRDTGVAHGLVVSRDQRVSARLAEGSVLIGPAQGRIELAPLVEGRYRIGCIVHPTMAAELVVTGG